MNNLRKFANTADYEAATLSRPAVSLIETSGKIKFDPDTYHGIVRVYYNIADASQEVVLYNAGSSSGSESGSESGSGQAGATPSAMWVDGNEEVVISTHRFNEAGLHYVDYDFEVPTIPEDTFENNNLVTKVVVADAVTAIGSGVFRSCANLVEVVSKPTTPPNLADGTIFSGHSNDLVIYVPADAVNTYKEANRWSNYASIIQAM